MKISQFFKKKKSDKVDALPVNQKLIKKIEESDDDCL